MPRSDQPDSSTAPSMGTDFMAPMSWAAYLACSWTWCIGMFLPVLLVRDYGLGGWFVFAIPNVIGAGAMGWVLARPGASERIVAEHRSACVAFSAITLAFHAFFLSWLAVRIIPLPWCIAAVAAGSALAVVLRSKRSIDLALAWIVLAVSVIVLVHGLQHYSISERRGLKDARDLLWLAPVCAFGFALCPYLDLTFHRAKQSTNPAGGKIAFGVGFGVFFLAMIVLTLLYEGDIVWDGRGSFGAAGLRTWVALHIAAQAGFTWMVHLRAQPPMRKRDVPIWSIAAILAIAAGVIVWVPQLQDFQLRHSQMLTGEAIYRIFMSFYGLVFPAYVWICMTPVGGVAPGPTRRALTVCAIAVAIAAPMFWMGFIVGQMFWLLPGLVVVLLARFMAAKS
jgi:hypothetical protein